MLKHKMNWLTRILFTFVSFLLFQSSIVPVSASPIVLEQSHHTGISEACTYDEIESLVFAEFSLTDGLRRVLLVKEVRPDYEVLARESSVAARRSTQGIKSLGAAAKGFSKNSFKSVNSKLLSKNGITDIHRFKQGFLGRNAILKHFDVVVRHTQSGELLIVRKSTQEIIEYTGTFIR